MTRKALILDSRGFYMRGQFKASTCPRSATRMAASAGGMRALWYRSGEMPVYEEIGIGNGRGYPGVASALSGAGSVVVVGKDGG
jgi:two-component system sensor histidine kinase ChvG